MGDSKPKADVFLDLLRRSGLVEKGPLDQALAELQARAGDEVLTDTDRLCAGLVEAGVITQWQAGLLLTGRYRGFFLGKYRLLSKLGSGGMSQVYLAEHVLMQRQVAIKVLPKNRVDDSSYLARFLQEARAAAALDHRNIVRAFDVDNEGTTHYLVMEYVPGRDLQKTVRDDGPMEPARAADYIRQAAEGLAHAHQAGLIHRDIKPANLLVDPSNVVKVLDLGLARFSDENQASLTIAHDENVLGTADYLAPEQAIDSHGVDGRADIYSLGCSLYFLLTGHAPFPDGTLPQRLMMHQKQMPNDIRNERSDVPGDLVEICTKMMAKKPGQRYQSADEVAAALGDWLAAHGHGSPGGSSARMAAISAARAAGSGSKPAPSSSRRPPGDTPAAGEGTPSGRRTSPSRSGPSRSGPSRSDVGRASVDTTAGSNQRTVKGSSGSSIARSEAGRSGSKLGRKGLPVAKKLDEPPASPQPAPVAPAPSPMPYSAPAAPLPPAEPAPSSSPLDFLEELDQPGSSGVGRRLVSRSGERPAYRASRKGIPIWLWLLIGGGAILALVMLALAVMQATQP